MNTCLRWDWELMEDPQGIPVRSLEIGTAAGVVTLEGGRVLEIAPWAGRVFARCNDQGQLPEGLIEEIESRAHDLLFRKALEQVAVIALFQ